MDDYESCDGCGIESDDISYLESHDAYACQPCAERLSALRPSASEAEQAPCEVIAIDFINKKRVA